MQKVSINENWELELIEDYSQLFLLIVEQSTPKCSFVHKASIDNKMLLLDFKALVRQFTEAHVVGLLQIYLVSVPNTPQILAQIKLADTEHSGVSDDARQAIAEILSRADCEILKHWRKEALTEKKSKKAKRKKYKHCNSITYSTGYPALDVAFFNARMGTDFDNKNSIDDGVSIPGAPSEGDTTGPALDTGGGATDFGIGEDLTDNNIMDEENVMQLNEAKRNIKRYYIRPQNIFCSKKEDILKALVQQVGENNCSVYSLKALEDHDDVHLLKPVDIIYYYDNGILYDKNHVKIMDYDLFVKNEEERKRFSNIEAVPDDKFQSAYADRLVEDAHELSLDFAPVNAYGEVLTESDEHCVICGEPLETSSNNPEPIAKQGYCCDACLTKFVIPARLEAGKVNY